MVGWRHQVSLLSDAEGRYLLADGYPRYMLRGLIDPSLAGIFLSVRYLRESAG